MTFFLIVVNIKNRYKLRARIEEFKVCEGGVVGDVGDEGGECYGSSHKSCARTK